MVKMAHETNNATVESFSVEPDDVLTDHNFRGLFPLAQIRLTPRGGIPIS